MRVDETASLQLKTALIGFHRLCGGHDGQSVAKFVMGLLDRAGVYGNGKISLLLEMSIVLIFFKASHFTMDNASSNLTMMQELEIMFRKHEVDFNATDRHIMC